MLVLTRKNQQSVVIGGCERLEQVLKITVLGIKEGKVRLGFEAAADIPVHRLDLWEQINAGFRPGAAAPPAKVRKASAVIS